MIYCSLCSHSEVVGVESVSLVPGDVLVVPPSGLSLPCDAALLTGHAIVNEAMLTGTQSVCDDVTVMSLYDAIVTIDGCGVMCVQESVFQSPRHLFPSPPPPPPVTTTPPFTRGTLSSVALRSHLSLSLFLSLSLTLSRVPLKLQVVQTRFYANQKVLAVVVRTGFATAKGVMLRSILFPRQQSIKLYSDAVKFVLMLAVLGKEGGRECV